MRRYQYVHFRYCRVGKMRCCSCGKKITEGQYRYHETENAYVPCHRACCPNDPQWNVLDQADKDAAIRRQEFEIAVLAFYDKWGPMDDDDFMSIVNNRPASA
jgi:hypothetical protein